MSGLRKLVLTISPFFSLLLPSKIYAQSTGLGFSNELSATRLVSTILSIAVGAAGGVAFLLLAYGGFRLVTSQGDPKALQDARTIITSALSGLLFIVFSVFILRLIGITILGLPL